MASKLRPKYLNLLQIRLPLPGVVSILHRASGVLLFLALPLLLYLFQQSLASPQNFSVVANWFAHPFAKLAGLVLAWAYFHHFCAGLRYLAMDMHRGAALPSARSSGKLVLLASLALTALFGAWLW